MNTRFYMPLISLLCISAFTGTPALAVPITGPSGPILETSVPITGEIEAITIADPGDPWSVATIRVRGQNVIIPRNLLVDLPNEVLTMQQMLKKAPPACQITGETGLAKNDKCNALATGAVAAINANRTAGGNIIAGMVGINKGVEVVQGTISFVDFTNHYFRVNGNIIPPGGADDGTGTMVRVNDPTSTHTIQKGPGCIPGNTVNCSPDTRFDVDPSNYTAAFLTGFPLCIPVTPNGANDPNCPLTNRPDVLNPAAFAISNAAFAIGGALPPVPVAADSRHFAPIWVGDSVIATGNFEVIGGVQFLSARAVQILVDLTTDRTRADQPEYLFIDEIGLPAGPAVEGHLFDSRIRFKASDHVEAVDVFTVHFDPLTNSVHERLLYTTECNKRQGVDLVVLPTGEFDLFMRMDFRGTKRPVGFEPCLDLFGLEDVAECVPFKGQAPAGALAGLIPAAPATAVLLAQATALCPAASAVPPVIPAKVIPAVLDVACGAPPSPFCTDNYNILYPTPRQVVIRGRRTEVGAVPGGIDPALAVARDVHGRPAQSGFYFLPVEFEDIGNVAETLGMSSVAVNFDSIPWLLDRRLSTNGCVGPCETTPQPLTPFPFVNVDARDTVLFGSFVTLQTAYPTPNQFFATAAGAAPGAPITTMPGNLIVGGVNPALALNPPAQPITPAPHFNLFAPVANDDSASAKINPVLPVKIKVLANDIPLAGTLDVSTVQIVNVPASGIAQVNPDGTVTYTPNTATTAGTDTFTYTVANSAGAVSNPATVSVTLIGAKTHTITAMSDAKGTITPSSTMTVNDGGSQTYTFTPNTGYKLVNVLVDGVSVGSPPPGTFTFTNIKEDGHNIKVSFIPDGATDGSGRAAVSDALRAMKIATGLIAPTASDLLHYDVAPLGADGIPAPDGQITAADALLILKKAAGFTTGF
jgi:Big-like domain-containing protein